MHVPRCPCDCLPCCALHPPTPQVHERQKGPASRVAPYLQQLPERVGTPVTWDDTQLQQLQYPWLIQVVRGDGQPGLVAASLETPHWLPSA